MKKNTNIGPITKLSFDVVECLATAFIAAVILLNFLFIKFTVDGSSMLPTLHGIKNDQDNLLIYHLFYEPKRGDIVTIDSPGLLDENIVKRVIALSGDTVKIDYSAGKVFVNGEAKDETYINEPGKPFNEEEWLKNNTTVTVPEGHIFVMGDNRNYSTDSRSNLVKFVNKKDVMGKVVSIYSPISRFKLFF